MDIKKYNLNTFYDVAKLEDLATGNINIDEFNTELSEYETQQKDSISSESTTKSSSSICENELISINDNKIENITKLSENVNDCNEVKLQFYINKVQLAIKNHKIFTIYGKFNIIRKSLIKRDWIEKCSSKYLSNLKLLTTNELLENCQPGNKYETILMSNLCRHCFVNFIWQTRLNHHNISLNIPYCNIMKRSKALSFTSKSGLIGCIENAHWHTIPDICEINVPRVHRLSATDKNLEFLSDYSTTYCISLLKFICETKPSTDIFNKFGTVNLNIIDKAINRIRSEISNLQHNNLNGNSDYPCYDDKEWLYCYDKINNIICHVEKLKSFTTINDMNICIDNCRSLLKTAIKYNLSTASEGFNNLWILKPAYSCRGNGIVIKKNISEILYFAKVLHKISYIVQKYIERPLLIYKTKFDIRQYILLSITDTKFNIWSYKNCYLRFSSQEYELCQLRKSVHITNNAVQKKFKNGERSDKLPSHNMWLLNEFKLYLHKEKRLPFVWQNVIYPGIKKNIITIVLASLDETEFIPNSYQLFGCDFILDENYEPILLEINANPDLSRSTIVTANICPTVLEDVIKVILDFSDNKSNDTGEFELIYSINWKITPINNNQTNNNIKMEIIGKKMKIKPREKSTIIHNHLDGRKKILKKRIIHKNNNEVNNNSNNNEVKCEKNNKKCRKYKRIIRRKRKLNVKEEVNISLKRNNFFNI